MLGYEPVEEFQPGVPLLPLDGHEPPDLGVIAAGGRSGRNTVREHLPALPRPRRGVVVSWHRGTPPACPRGVRSSSSTASPVMRTGHLAGAFADQTLRVARECNSA